MELFTSPHFSHLLKSSIFLISDQYQLKQHLQQGLKEEKYL